jgi:hypothetical protein
MLTTLAAFAPATAGADPISPGFDLFETDPGSTYLQFQSPDTAVPPSFFGPGSDPFAGQVHFGGDPLLTFQGQSIGDTDTVVQRLNAADPASLSGATVPIEMVQLSLQSIEPITVTYNGGQSSELWDVHASLSPTSKSNGAIFIEPLGTFGSQLQVIPLLTFTRLSDGNQLEDGAPWRAGCVPPALAVPGVNDGFCPGLTTGGEKQLTVEQAALAAHGVYPAQPALEHFECYTTKRQRFRRLRVGLRDQFGARKARVTARAELCNPAQKRIEPFINTRAHLQCYRTSGPALKKPVAVRNQFGSQRLLVGKPRRLCLPSQKRLVRRRGKSRFKPIQIPIDHFQCYSVSKLTPLRAVQSPGRFRLSDQFGRRAAGLGRPFQLCAPAEKTLRRKVTPLQHPVRHLVCYRIKPKAVSRRVQIRNQFETRILRTRKSVALCVPSNKLVL